MVFASPIFIFAFLPAVLLLYALAGKSWRNAVLVIASAVFYMWGEGYAIRIMAVLIPLNWGLGLALDRTEQARARKLILLAAVILDLGVLVYFKYANFIVHNLDALAGTIAPVQLPLGISFFTFHLLSYVIDVYRRRAPAQARPLDFALYISFFPQLIAGPIVRYRDIAAQLTRRDVTLEKFAAGVERFTLGLAKKVLVANPMGLAADRVFALSSADISTPAAWLGVVAYTFQIYFDFSAYSDMAIGLARMFGFDFLENFNYPYIATSIRDFWRRWHISLSNWFRDYLYIPLGGDRFGRARTAANLLLVFLLCGLWHGASWNFVVWGLIHGAFLSLERGPFGAWLGRMPRVIGHVYALLVVITAWVFFRVETLPDALSYLAVMFGLHTGGGFTVADILDRKTALVMIAAAIGSTPVFAVLSRDWLQRGLAPAAISISEGYMTLVRPAVIAGLLVLSAAVMAGQSYNPFIYFRF